MQSGCRWLLSEWRLEVEYSGSMIQVWSTSTELMLACGHEPGVCVRSGNVYPRSIHGMIHSITAAEDQFSFFCYEEIWFW